MNDKILANLVTTTFRVLICASMSAISIRQASSDGSIDSMTDLKIPFFWRTDDRKCIKVPWLSDIFVSFSLHGELFRKI